MKEFLLVFRAEYQNMPQGTPAEMEQVQKKWLDWMAGMAATGNLVDRGAALEGTGRVVRPSNVVTNGPYAEIKELVGGFTLVKADTYEAAVELAKGCPLLFNGGNVEVREIRKM